MHKNGPIMQSLLDLDLYTFTMMQVILHRFPDAEVEYAFRCRTPGVNLVPYMAEIEEEIAAFCELRFKQEELSVLGSLYFMKPWFVDMLELYRPRMKHVRVVRAEEESGAIDIRIRGPWWSTIPFEQPCLSIVNEVYFRNTYDMEEREAVAMERLSEKIKVASEHPVFDKFRFNEFGTRRRASRKIQERVLGTLKGCMPIQLVGTSNVLLAHKYKLNVMGTMAHQYLQACQVLGGRLRDFQKFAFDVWAEEYQGHLGIALTDVINMDAFLEDFGPKYCKLFDGMRHDSGEPDVWARKAIQHYRKNRIDPKTKTLVFSDSLTFPKALDLQQEFGDQINTAFGIGTYLSNDTGVPALNAVIKMVTCNGEPVAKISDAPGKSMCKDDAYIALLKKTFDIQ